MKGVCEVENRMIEEWQERERERDREREREREYNTREKF